MTETRPIPFGRFQLYRRIGAGGMGEVFRAEMLGPDGFARRVVVKRLLAELTREAEAVAMFIDEARLAARLVHPNIVQVYDFGKVGNRYFLVMELVEGCDLSRLLHFYQEQKKILPLGASLYVVSSMLDALAYAHEARDEQGHPLGLVHRDISPSNVLLSQGGEVKLTDFGIAKTRARMPRTTFGQLKGKIPYMSPEQAEGRLLDCRSDLFSLGVLLFQLVAGQRPFRGKSADDVLEKIRLGTYVPPTQLNPQIGPNVADVVKRALDKRPDGRFPSAREFKQALTTAAARDGVVTDIESLRQAVQLTSEAAEAAFEEEDTSLERPEPGASGAAGVAGAVGKTRDPTELILPGGSGSPDAGMHGSGNTAQIQHAHMQHGGMQHGGMQANGQMSGQHAPGQLVPGATPAPGYGNSQVSTARGAGRASMRHFAITVVVAVASALAAVVLTVRFLAPTPPDRKVRVALRVYPAQKAWLRSEIFDPFERKCNCKVEITEFYGTDELGRLIENGEADLAEVDDMHAPLLVHRSALRRLSDLGERTDANGFRDLRASLRPEALQLGTYSTVTGEDLFLLPRRLETLQLIFRPAMVRLAVEEFPKHKDALDEKLKSILHRGLPSGYALKPDVSRWTSWDLLALSWTWSRIKIRGEIKPRYAIAPTSDRLFADPLMAQAVTGGASASEAWRATPQMVDLFLLFALFRELDVLHPMEYRAIDSAQARKLLASGELGGYLGHQIDAGLIVGNGQEAKQLIDDPRDLDVAPPPRPVPLDAVVISGSDRESTSALLSGWGWGIPRRSAAPELAMRLILFMLSKERQAAEIERFPLLRMRNDMDPVWWLSRRTNRVGDQQLSGGRGRPVPWPVVPGEPEAMVRKLDQAFKKIVLRRGYKLPLSRASIEELLRKELSNDKSPTPAP